MVWIPVNRSAICSDHPKLMSCQASLLAFFTFVTQNFNHSIDDKFTDTGKIAQDKSEYDFIIVGAGSAGCVLANRLSEIKNWKVLLLEAGEEEPLVADVPGLFDFLGGSNIDWGYKTQPEPIICKPFGNSCPTRRGKVMGGSSTINAMVYIRGNKHDYDNWASLGNQEWSYKDVLPYFKKLEDLRIEELAKDTATRGVGGYQTIEYPTYKNKETDLMINAWVESGVEETKDYNSQKQLGVFRVQFTNVHGARQSANGAYLRPIRGKRPNLTIETQAHVTKVIIDPKTNRAVGVEYTSSKDKITKKVFATKEVIVSAGTFDSPKLLMLSGIGPADDLRKANINVIKDLPVGRNLQNHVGANAFRLPLLGKWSTLTSGKNILKDAVYWLKTHKGPFSVGNFHSAAFTQTKFENQSGVPDILHVYSSFIYEDAINDPVAARSINYYPSSYRSGLEFYSYVLNPKSRGYVTLNKTDPINSPPLIHLNSLTVSDDIETLVEGIQQARRVLDTETFKKYNFTEYKNPVKVCKNFTYSSKEYLRCVVENFSFSINHPVGSCKMGPPNDSTTVVDSELRVHGIKGLRVIDASIMPVIVRGSTHGPTVMIAEKGSDMIKKDWLKS